MNGHQARSWRLDVGCGQRKRAGFVGFDASRNADVDVIGSLAEFLPFRDGRFEEAWMSHVLEHVESPVHVMEEIWRVCRDGALIEVRGPHFSTPNYVWGDPTHRRGLSLGTFQCFTPQNDWYVTRARFSIVRCSLVKDDASFRAVGGKVWYWPIVIWNKAWSRIINVSPAMISRYERLLARFIAFQEIHVVLAVEKKRNTQQDSVSAHASAV